MRLVAQSAIISTILLSGFILADRHGAGASGTHVLALLGTQLALIWISSWLLYRRVKLLAPDSDVQYLDSVPRRRQSRIAYFNKTAESLAEKTQDPMLVRHLHLRKLQGVVLIFTVIGLVTYTLMRFG